jgi:pimeloyl-ACP methyl ester carboxylesterase
MVPSFIAERRSTYAGTRTRELAVAGSGPTVLLLHGFGDSADTWRPVLERLHDAGRAGLAVDLPGFGDADPLREGELLPQLDIFVAEVIRKYGVNEHVVVVGNSLGAAVAVRAGRDTRLPITAVVALGVAGVNWTRLTASVRLIAAILSFVPMVPIPQRIHRIALRRALSHLLYGDRSAVDRRVVADFAERIPDTRAIRRLTHLGAGFVTELNRTRHHGGVVVPMTVIHGGRDRLIPLSAAHILHGANAGSRLVVIDRAGHCPQLDAVDIVTRHACEFAGDSTPEKEILNDVVKPPRL